MYFFFFFKFSLVWWRVKWKCNACHHTISKMVNPYGAKIFLFSIQPFLKIFSIALPISTIFSTYKIFSKFYHIFGFSSSKFSQIFFFQSTQFSQNFFFYKLKKNFFSFSSKTFSQYFFLFPTFNLQQQLLFCDLAHHSFFFTTLLLGHSCSGAPFWDFF